MTPYEKFIAAGAFTKAGNLGLWLDTVLWEALGVDLGEAGSGLLLFAIIFFIILYSAYRNLLQAGAPNGTPLRAVWLWDDPSNKYPNKPGNFVSSVVVCALYKPYSLPGWKSRQTSCRSGRKHSRRPRR